MASGFSSRSIIPGALLPVITDAAPGSLNRHDSLALDSRSCWARRLSQMPSTKVRPIRPRMLKRRYLREGREIAPAGTVGTPPESGTVRKSFTATSRAGPRRVIPFPGLSHLEAGQIEHVAA